MYAPSLPKSFLLLPLLLAMLASGCATREFVQTEVNQVGKRIEGLEGLVALATQRLDIHSSRLGTSENRLTQAEQNAAALAKRNDETRSGLDDANQRINGIAADVVSTRGQIESSSLEIARSHQRLDQVDARIDQTNRKLQGTVATIAMAESRITALETQQRAAAAASAEATPSSKPAATAPSHAAPVLAMPAAAVEPSVTVAAAPPVAAVEPAVAPAHVPAQTPVQTPTEPAVANPAVANPVVAMVAADAATAPVAQTPVADSPMESTNSRLDQIAALLAAADQKIAANTGALDAAVARVSGLEQGLAITDQRTRGSEDELKQAQQKLGEVASQLGDARSRIENNSNALAAAGKRIDQSENGLARVVAQLETGEKNLAESNQRIALAEDSLKQQDARLSKNEADDSRISALAQEALDRAQAAHKLAEGKLVFESVLTGEVTNFGFEKARLSDEAKQKLAEFAERLKTENQNIYIEIQGHTDSSGPEFTNMMLSRQRAEQVRDYLHQEAGIPLHRLAVAAYGETRPVADNKTKAGRMQNRRVVMVVLK